MTNELGNKALSSLVEIQRTAFETSSTAGESVSRDGLRDGISASATGLSKTEVVVGGDIETTGTAAGGVQVDIVVVAFAIVTDNRAARDSGNRRGETVVKSDFKSSGIK